MVRSAQPSLADLYSKNSSKILFIGWPLRGTTGKNRGETVDGAYCINKALKIQLFYSTKSHKMPWIGVSIPWMLF